MNLPLVQSLVDQALADASRKVLSDPLGDYGGEDQAAKLAQAAQELKDALAAPDRTTPKPDLRMPSYEDPWVALAYAQWYQLRQIHLAYSLTRDLLANETVRGAPRHKVHDVGCGALAFAIGLAMAVAERLEFGNDVAPFEYRGYDSQALRMIGSNHWTALKRIADAQSQLTRLASAMELIDLKLHDVSEGEIVRHFADHQGACRWLVAQHVAYEVNQDEVRGDLAEWFASVQPNVGFVTGPWFKANTVNHINPSGGPPLCRMVGVPHLLVGDATAITDHRREIAGDLAAPSINLLLTTVSWTHAPGGGAPYALRYLQIPER